MHIDSNENIINANQASLGQWRHTVRVERCDGDKADVGLKERFAGVIEQACRACETETAGLDEIKAAVNAGQFDTPQAFRETAVNIVRFGI